MSRRSLPKRVNSPALDGFPDVSQFIRKRLLELHCGQKELASAAEVTESYISQLLSRKKLPPAPARTDIYEKIAPFLGVPADELARLAEMQRRRELRDKIEDPPVPLFRATRELVLRKCDPAQRAEVSRIFGKQNFGELERLVTQKILEVAQSIAREELRNEEWLRALAQVGGRSYKQMRVAVLEFLDTDTLLHVSVEGCVSFLDPMIESWNIDLEHFGMEIILNRRLSPDIRKRFAFIEVPAEDYSEMEPGLVNFLNNPSLRSNASDDEIAFLKRLRFRSKRPSALYYYRELQNLRDPLHFTE